MEISDLLTENLIELNLTGETKEEVLAEMVDLLKEEAKITSKSEFYQQILAREEEGTTGLGRGVAIPHGKSDVVNELALVFGRSEAGIDFDSRDGKPVHLFFMVADYEGHSPEYLELVGSITREIRKEDYRAELLNATDTGEVIAATEKYE
jgi:fructose-specific phosphotransferase system IIA component